MTTLMQWMTWVPSFAIGALLSGWMIGPIMKQRGYEKGKEEQRVLDGPMLYRKPLPIESGLPPQYGTKPEHERRQRPPIGYGEVTDDTLVVRTVDTAARQARVVTGLAYRTAQAGIAVDRVVAAVRQSRGGRHRADGQSTYEAIAARRPKELVSAR